MESLSLHTREKNIQLRLDKQGLTARESDKNLFDENSVSIMKINLENERNLLSEIRRTLLEKIKTPFYYYKPMKEALLALEPDKDVEIECKNGQIKFSPRSKPASAGIVFYPGYLVDFRAYAPMARSLSKKGYVVIIENLSISCLANNRFKKIATENSQITNWYTGGHSLGGCVASEAAYFNQEKVNGVFMLASFPIVNFKNSHTKILDIRGSIDKILTPNADKFYRMTVSPLNTKRVVIEGGNHSNFGYYGHQMSDGEAKISRYKQQQQVVSSILEFIKGKKQ